MMSQFILFFTIIMLCCTIVIATETTTVWTNEPLPSPFTGYGSINTEHFMTLDNYKDGKHLHYVINNLPAQGTETLYEFAALFTINAGVPTSYKPVVTLHVARPRPGITNGITFIKSAQIEGLISGVKKNVYSLGIVLEKNDFLVLSSPDDMLKLRVGANNIGLPIQYGIISVSADDEEESKVQIADTHYDTHYTLSDMPTNPALPEGQYLQICSAYGTFGQYIQFGSAAGLYMFAGGVRQIITPADDNKVITDFTVGIGQYGQFGIPDGTDYPTPVTVTIIIARIDINDGLYKIIESDNTRKHVYNGVQHAVQYMTNEELTVKTGDVVGIRIDVADARVQFGFNPLDLTALTYYTYTGATEGIVAGALNSNAASVSSPKFTFHVNTKGRSTLNGDPQFSGFQGQSFQFHGLADEHFNLISTPTLQLNAHFVYLSSGKCDYNNTICFQHPGTYVDILGFIIPSTRGDVYIKLVSGTHHDGLRAWIGNGDSELHEIRLNQHVHGLSWLMNNDTTSRVTIIYNEFGQFTIDTPLFNIDVVNSDYFFNLGMSLKDRSMLSIGSIKHTITDRTTCEQDRQGYAGHADGNLGVAETTLMKKYPNAPVSIHGLIGQTWRNVRVCQKSWMGAVQDYVTSDLFSVDYFFNHYSQAA